jgi:hypothetical protein
MQHAIDVPRWGLLLEDGALIGVFNADNSPDLSALNQADGPAAALSERITVTHVVGQVVHCPTIIEKVPLILEVALHASGHCFHNLARRHRGEPDVLAMGPTAKYESKVIQHFGDRSVKSIVPDFAFCDHVAEVAFGQFVSERLYGLEVNSEDLVIPERNHDAIYPKLTDVPPSTGRQAPVMKRASSLARNRAA